MAWTPMVSYTYRDYADQSPATGWSSGSCINQHALCTNRSQFCRICTP